MRAPHIVIKNGNKENTMDILTLGIALLLTVVSYLIFPIIYVKKNGKVSENVGKKLALWNSIICAVIFLVLGICIGLTPAANGTMFAPAVLYYFIAKSILIDKNIPNTKNAKNQLTQKENNNYIICPDCGMQIFDDEEKCSFCGYTPEREIKEVKEIEEEPLEEIEAIETTSSSTPNTNQTNIVKSALKESIIKIQKATIAIFCLFVTFCIFYPIIGCSIRDDNIPNQTEYATNRLTYLDSTQTVYCNSSGNYNYVYIKQDNKVILYRFLNYSMYNSSGGVRSGYATTQEIKNQFADVILGTPNLYFVSPATYIIGWVLGIALCVTCIILCIIIHQRAKEDIFRLSKTDKTLIELKTQFKNDDISLSTYNKERKSYYSKYILKNNKFFDIFKIIY